MVVEGIPCQFQLEAEVKNFDVVFMAEHSPGDGATAPDVANDERENGEQTAAPAAKPVEEVETDKVVVSAAATTDAVRAKVETEAPASTIDTVETAESQVASTDNAVGSSGSPVESGAKPVIDGSVVEIEPPVSGANQVVVGVEDVTAGVGKVDETVAGDAAAVTVEGKGESPLAEGEISADATSVDVMKGEGELKGEKPGVMEGGVSSSDGAPSGAAVEKEAAERMGCSTVTTPLVVPSTELDFKTTEGQWRFLEVPPESEFVNGAIEVTKGVRFLTSLEGHNKNEDEVSEAPFGRLRGS